MQKPTEPPPQPSPCPTAQPTQERTWRIVARMSAARYAGTSERASARDSGVGMDRTISARRFVSPSVRTCRVDQAGPREAR